MRSDTVPAGTRFLDFVAFGAERECWPWNGATNALGYGRFRWDGKAGKAHRYSYLFFRGYLPPLELDHVCRNPRCVNPDHLEPVTHAENMRRAARDVCRRGHAFTPDNEYRDSSGRRACRTCRADRFRKWYLVNYSTRVAPQRRAARQAARALDGAA